MGNAKILSRGLLVAGLMAALCAYGLAAEGSADKNQGAAAQPGRSTSQPGNANQATTQPGAAQQRTPAGSMPQPGQAMTLVKTSELIGKDVKDPQGEKLGVVHDLILAPDYRQVSYVAVSSGGVFGINSTLHAVPWQAVRADAKGNVTLSATKEQFKQAAGFTNSYWPSQGDPRWLSASAGTSSSAATSSTGAGAATAGRTDANNSQARQPAGQTAASSPQAGQSAPAMGAAGQTATANQDIQMRRVTHLTGTAVRNTENQDLGDIEDFAISASDGRIVYDIIAYGGMAGIGEKYAAVPASAVQLQPQNHMATLNATKQTLDSVAFKSDQFPDLSSPQYMQRVSQLFPAARTGTALGYIPSGSPQAQQAATDKAWGASGQYTKSFNASTVKTVKGTIQSVGSFMPEGATAGVAGGLRLRVKTSDGNLMTVYAGPSSYAEQKNFFVAPGDEISITGSESKIGQRSVIIASELKKGDQTLQLRDQSGKPLWSTGQEAMRTGSSQTSGATKQPLPGQSSNRTRQQ
jgi:sporulation protein YlmC with PRC-barrel domain